jgi:hypothetical protein
MSQLIQIGGIGNAAPLKNGARHSHGLCPAMAIQRSGAPSSITFSP